MPSSASLKVIGCLLALVVAGCGSDTEGGRGNVGGSAGSKTPTGGGTGSKSGGGPGDPFGNGNGTGPIASGGSTGSMLPPGGGNDECAQAKLHSMRTMPTILFVIDGSGSMCAPFGGSTRWQALRTALVDPTMGLIYRLQQSVSFGMLLYDGTIDLLLAVTGAGGGMVDACSAMYLDMKAEGECPGLIEVAPAIGNAAMIDMQYPATELGGSTPTDKAMNHAVDQLEAMISTNPDVMNNPLYIILATDGQPNDICVGGVGGDGTAQKQGVIAAVDRAQQSGITTFVISTAGGDAALEAHLNEVAKHGNPADPMAHTYAPTNPEDLVNTLATLLGGAVGCTVALNGEVTLGQECRGSVLLNGQPLPCCTQAGGAFTCNDTPVDPADGWMLKDPRTIELTGVTCTNFLATVEVNLEASFPCDAFSPD
jgi:hypothetical protein